MGIKPDITGRLRAKLVLQHPLAPTTDLTTQTQLSLSQDRMVGTSTPMTNTGAVQPSDRGTAFDQFVDQLTSASSWVTTP